MPIKRGYLYVVDFNPRIRTKPGKLRPALVLQSDLVNEAGYPSTVVVPTTTRLVENAGILRFRLKKGQGAIARDSDLLLGQVIAVANESFRQEIGSLPNQLWKNWEIACASFLAYRILYPHPSLFHFAERVISIDDTIMHSETACQR